MVSEADVTAVVSIFGRIADLRIPLADKRKQVLDALCWFFGGNAWEMKEVSGSGRKAVGTARRLVATRDGRQLIMRRRRDQTAFGPRERQLFEMVTSRVPWLLDSEPVAFGESISLSPRMRKVLVLVCLGGTRKGIAEELNVRPGTVDGYVRDLYRVFGVRTQTELVRMHSGSEMLEWRGP